MCLSSIQCDIRQEETEVLNKGQMAVEQMRKAFDNGRSVNSGDQSKAWYNGPMF